MFQGSFEGVKSKMEGCFKYFQGDFKVIRKMVFQGSFNGVERVLKEVSKSFKKILRVFQECFKGV